MNFSNKKNYFNSFFKNMSKNKYSFNFFNTKINSNKSLINFSNNYNFCTLLNLSRIMTSIKFRSLVRFSDSLSDSETNICKISENSNYDALQLDLKTFFLNEICMLNTRKII